MERIDGHWVLDLPDLIRINQLIRHRIDLPAFEDWYDSLIPAQRHRLTLTLCEFAYQAGCDERVTKEAILAAGLTSEHPLVRQSHDLRLDHPKGNCPDWMSIDQRLKDLPPDDRRKVFQWFVFLFGLAEGRVYRRETKRFCNHWWHRDLLDERVVQAILTDPQFYSTSMKDDDAIKAS
jgi:hypothetical protein